MTSIYCIGRNYAKHARELGNEVPTTPVVFTKTSSALRGFEQSQIAFSNETFHYEGELVLKIAKDHSLNELYSIDSIESIAFGIDLTRRQEQSYLKENGLPWVTSKSFLGSAIIGTFYDRILFDDLNNIDFEFFLKNEKKQIGNTSQMLFKFEDIINYINTFSPLNEGDLIMTGTPDGVGNIVVGDNFSFRFNFMDIEECGIL